MKLLPLGGSRSDSMSLRVCVKAGVGLHTMTHLSKLLALSAFTLFSGNAVAVDPPTMGWSSWNTFGLNISESIIKRQADVMVSGGYAKLGYDHINIDDGYFGGRDEATGQLLIHKTRFPNGLKPVVDYVHKKGLKVGIYSDGGPTTCGYYHGGDKTGNGVGLYQHEQQDCDFFFKEMGFDFIKVDFCGGVSYHNDRNLNLSEKERYTIIANAIAKTGREDVRMNICRWDFPGNWAHEIPNVCSWRTTGDINCSWGSVKDIIQQNLYLSAYCFGGRYNDMDMLEVGRGLSVEEDKTHFGMWCLLSSPLLIGCDVSNLADTPKNLLKNKYLIEVNQDSLGLQAYVVARENDTYTLVKDFGELNGLTRVCGIYNPTDKKQTVTLKFSDLCLGGEVTMFDLFKKRPVSGTFHDSYEVSIPAHGMVMYRVTAEERYERTLYEAETAYMQGYTELTWNQPQYEANAACSGGMMASWLGNNSKGDIVWRHVYSEQGGEYTLSTKFLSGESRSMTLEINGKRIASISASNKGWGTVQTNKRKITLQPGDNVIRLYNNSAWMPNIDCIELQKIIPTAINGVEGEKSQGDERVYGINGVRINSARPAKGVYIKGGKKYAN